MMKKQKADEIRAYMEERGLPYECDAQQALGAIYTASDSHVVMALVEHPDFYRDGRWYVGYYGDEELAQQVQRNLLTARPKKRFVKYVNVVKNAGI